jgi:hypothetical protein
MTLNNQNSQRSNGGGSGNGNAQRNYDRYIVLAKDAASRGDRIESENCYQHAEHYFRAMREKVYKVREDGCVRSRILHDELTNSGQ